MARRIKTTLEKLDASVARILARYGGQISENAGEIAVRMGRRGAAALREESAGLFGGTGKYAQGWTSSQDKRRYYTGVIVYNKLPGLPHLLENGHLMLNGQRWLPPRKHIEPVENELIRQFEQEVLSKL